MPDEIDRGHAGIERKLGNLETGLAWLKEWLESSQAKAERDSDGIRLRLETSQAKAENDREGIRVKLIAIDRKIDPIVIRLDALEFQVKAHEVIITSMEDRRKDWTTAMRVGRWLVYLVWMLSWTVALWWSEEIKPVFGKLMKLWGR